MPDRIHHDLARLLRQQKVPAEQVLWRLLRNRELGGFKFRRQHPISGYFADFACLECMLVVELDGESHLASEKRDEERTQRMIAEGWHVLRFWNTSLFDDLQAVCECVHRACMERQKSTPRRGEG
jgi:very-short-patch-repair endonuclease